MQPQSSAGPQWQPPSPYQRPKNNRTLLIVLAVVAVVIVLCCGGVLIAGTLGNSTKPAPARTTTVVRTADDSTPAAPSESSPSPSSAPTPVAMPNVVGKNAAAAQDELKRLGVTNVTFGSSDPSASVVLLPQNWVVTDQSVPAGQLVQPGQTVVLSCKKSR